MQPRCTDKKLKPNLHELKRIYAASGLETFRSKRVEICLLAI